MSETKLDDKNFDWVVWVGGVEVNDHQLNLEQAFLMSKNYTSKGYDQVHLENVTITNGYIEIHKTTTAEEVLEKSKTL